MIGSIGLYARRYFGSVGACPCNLKFQKGYTSQIAQIEFVPTMTMLSVRGAERRSNLTRSVIAKDEILKQSGNCAGDCHVPIFNRDWQRLHRIATDFALAMTLRVNFVGPDSWGQGFELW